MKINWKVLILSILLPLAVGGLSALLSAGSMQSFNMMAKPPLSPPGILFPIVWTILFVLMGIASYLVYTSDTPSEKKASALKFYALQLVVNFFWSIIFFSFKAYLFAFFWLILLWVLIVITIVKFWQADQKAALLLFPYIIWVTFAGYLNLAIYFLNR